MVHEHVHEATRRLAAGRMGVSVVLPRSRKAEGGAAAALAGRPGLSWRWQEGGGSGGCGSLGRCGVITRALSAWTPTQRSRTDCLPASSSRCVGAERTVARLVHWQPAFSVRVRMDAGGAAVVCTSSGNHWAGALSAWTPTQRSRTDRLPASWSSCVGAERTAARSVRWQPGCSVRGLGEELRSCAIAGMCGDSPRCLAWTLAPTWP